MLPPAGVVADQRILQGRSATLTWQNVDQDGTPTAAAGAVTVGVTRSAGTTVVAAGTATTAGDETGEHHASLTATHTSALDLLTATWTDAGDSSTHTTKVEVVGGYLFSVQQCRDFDRTLQDDVKYPTADIVARRLSVEHEVESILGFACVPRFATVTLDGTGDRDLHLPYAYVRSVSAVTVDGTAWTAGQLAGFQIVGEHRDVLRLADGDAWEVGDGQNVTVTLTHGLDQPLPDIRDAGLLLARYRLNKPSSGLPVSAESATPPGGVGTFKPSAATKYRTGVHDVDRVLLRYSIHADETGTDGKSSGPTAAARPLAYSPQRNSLFHTR